MVKKKILRDVCWTYATHKGQKPAEHAYATGHAKGHTIFVSWHRRFNVLFGSFMSVAAFIDFYAKTSNSDRSFYWLNYSDRHGDESTHLYLDVEWTSPTEECRPLDRLIPIHKGIRALLDTDDNPLHTCNSRLLSDGTFKHSYHLHWCAHTFPSQIHVGRFVTDILIPYVSSDDRLFYVRDNKRRMIIDPVVYKRRQAFRVAGSHKRGERMNKMPARTVIAATRPTVSGVHTVSDQLVLHESTRHAPRSGIVPYTPDQALEKELVGMLVSHGDTITQVRQVGPSFFVGETDATAGRTCLITRHHCVRNRCYLNIDETGVVWYHCMSSSGGHDMRTGRMIGRIGSGQLISWDSDGKFTGVSASEAKWPDSVRIRDIITENARINRHPVPAPGEKCLVCIAGMGEGKTYSTERLASSYGPSARILIICPRISLTIELANKYPGFVHYRDPNAYNANRIVVEYESLHNLVGKDGFDLVIIDEVRSVLSSMMQAETNKHHIGDNAEIFKTLLRGSRRTITLDADTESDNVVPTALSHIFPGDGEITVARYGNYRMNRRLDLLPDEDVFINRVCESLAGGAKTSIACRTKRRALHFADLVRKKFPDKRIVEVTADISSADLKEFLADVDGYLADVDFFVYTSKVSVGIDINIEWGKVFVDTRGNGCNARELLQMVGRFRTLTSETVDVLISSNAMFVYNDPDELRRDIHAGVTSRREFLSSVYQPLVRMIPSIQSGVVTMSPDWVTRVFIETRIETRKSCAYELARLATNRHWGVYLLKRPQHTDSDSTLLDESIESVKRAEGEMFEDIFNEMATSSIDVVTRSAKERIRDGTSDNRDQRASEMGYALSHWPGMPSLDDAKIAVKDFKQIRNRCTLEKCDTMDVIERNAQRLPRHAWADITFKAFGQGNRYIGNIMEILGMETFGDGTQTVQSSVLTQNTDALTSLAEKASAAYGVSIGRRKGVLGKLNCLLRSVFGVHLSVSRRKRQRSNGRTNNMYTYTLACNEAHARLAETMIIA